MYFEKYLKYKNKYLALKKLFGGLDDTYTNIEELKDVEYYSIDKIIPILVNYSSIYIGIGAKSYSSNYVPEVENTGIYQLVPSFLINETFDLDRVIKKKLIIIIDEFINSEEVNYNKNNILHRIRDISNIEYLIINSKYDENIHRQVINVISNLEINQNIFICNYVCFNDPSRNELRITNEINLFMNQLQIRLIDKLMLTKPEELPKNKNVYKWLGFFEPRFVCKIDNFDYRFHKLRPLFETLKNDPKNKSTISKLIPLLEENCLKIYDLI